MRLPVLPTNSTAGDAPVFRFEVAIPTDGITVLAPFPMSLTVKTIEEHTGITANRLRKLARAGLRHLLTPEGPVVLTEDLRAYLIAHGSVTRRGVAAAEEAHPDRGDDVAEIIAAAGGRRVRP
jgi:hypothetical protein